MIAAAWLVDRVVTAVGGTVIQRDNLDSEHMKNRAYANSLPRVVARPSRPLAYIGCMVLAAVAIAATSAFPGAGTPGPFLAASIAPGISTMSEHAPAMTNTESPVPVMNEFSHDAVQPSAAPVIIEETPISEETIRWFNGRPLRAVKTITMKVTAYSPDEQSCGKWADGITASGYSVFTNGGKLVAADTSILPFGTLISVPGYDNGDPVPVLDRGGAIKGHRLDVLYPTHRRALKWGVQDLEVTVWEYADGEPSDFRQQH